MASPLIKPIQTITIDSDFVSKVITRIQHRRLSIQVNMNDAITFDVEVQESIDNKNWATVKDSNQTGLTNTDSPLIYDINNGNCNYYRLAFTNVSAEATFEIYAN